MNPNSVPTSTHVVHILASVGSLLILIGSVRQAQDSLREFRAEFQRLRDELGDRINQLRGVAIDLALRFSQVMPDEIVQTTYLSAQLVILIGSLYPFLRDRAWARRQLPEDPELRALVAVVGVALLGGFRPALLAAVTGVLAADFLYTEPLYSLRLAHAVVGAA